MYFVALKMLMGDRAKFTGLLLGIAFTAFLVTFAASYFCGFMTRGFALIAENPATDVWVMDPAVSSTEETINMPDSALMRVRSVSGVRYAAPMALGNIDARLANGRFQSFQVIGVDDATLTGAPVPAGHDSPDLLRRPDAAIVDAGGTSGKLGTPLRVRDQWPYDGAHLDVPLRDLAPGDELLADDSRIRVLGVSHTLPRYPPRPLLYMTYSNALRVLPSERKRLTFILVTAMPGVNAVALARRIERVTGLRARASSDFEADTVRWYLVNSEDVGDMVAMILLAMTVGFGVAGIMLYMYTYENLRQYAVLKAMGTGPGTLSAMIFVQAATSAILGAGVGLGVCALVGQGVTAAFDYPFRMMWYTPLVGGIGVLIVSLTAAAVSIRPVIRLQPGVVFAGR
ncbi:MAG: ABC transporter permease [Candidatus Thiodiazotropha sp.]